jgi:hypothetical protein
MVGFIPIHPYPSIHPSITTRSRSGISEIKLHSMMIFENERFCLTNKPLFVNKALPNIEDISSCTDLKVLKIGHG